MNLVTGTTTQIWAMTIQTWTSNSLICFLRLDTNPVRMTRDRHHQSRLDVLPKAPQDDAQGQEPRYCHRSARAAGSERHSRNDPQ